MLPRRNKSTTVMHGGNLYEESTLVSHHPGGRNNINRNELHDGLRGAHHSGHGHHRGQLGLKHIDTASLNG